MAGILLRKLDNMTELQVLNKFRKSIGLNPIKISKKKCLNCDVKFESEGKHNRMCNICAKVG